MASDILGFSDMDKRVVALAAYYHSHLLFNNQNEGRPRVDKTCMPLVAKLAAILRLADAMDRSYLQKIEKCKVTLKGNEMQIFAVSRKI